MKNLEILKNLMTKTFGFTRIDNITILYIYHKENPENIQGDNLLDYCLEEYCLQKQFLILYQIY